ncbi:glycine cleavage system aminomethyltransferase GcvT [Amnibacterium sp. CER49]|uniref:glycine cleavage system aminomethyltransferase GcvT n=1 Tax=Amnibacterium sp. CER49 TaxID=3039161 RepID=UPI002449E020|nr:glycine cleavage system aminomethyltransferase GcvT [Amnibacterium sp. CER49]MDH2445357.1 glycine cleavage system aminomethyltransferase GcvT [Amnibacterium sp. CER49]
MTEPSSRRSPLHDVHVREGAAFTDFGGWEMPLKFGSELAEHTAVRTAAGLFDLSHMGEIVVLGPQAAEALDAALLGELSLVEEGRARYTLLLNEQGGVLDDLVVYRTGQDRFLVVANAANREVVAAALRERAAAFDCAVQDESDDVGLIALQGPLSLDVLLETGGFSADGDGRTEERFAELVRGLGNYRFLAGEFRGHPVLVARTGYTGEYGFEIFTASGVLAELWSALLSTGRGSGVLPVGLAARDTLRLEAGMPLYGNELLPVTTPQQAGLGRLVRREKRADYVGRAAVEATEAGSGRVLVGLAAEGRRAGRKGYPVRAGDREVGVVTSGALSPTLGHPIAMAYVDQDARAAELSIDVRGTGLPVTVVPLPFYKRKA